MIKNQSAPLASVARPHRRSLADLATLSEPQESPAPQTLPPVAATPPAPVQPAPSGRSKYPSATVYLPRRAIRLIKEIGLEEERRISDILAEAVDEYLQKRGHPSLKKLSE